MRLLLLGFGRVLVDLALLEAKDDDDEDPEPGPVITLGFAHTQILEEAWPDADGGGEDDAGPTPGPGRRPRR